VEQATHLELLLKHGSPAPDDVWVPTSWSHGPRIRALTRRQVDCVLSRNNVARVAFHNGFRVELRPVHYVYAGGVFFGRSSFDMKTVSWIVAPEIVLEVDEVEGLFQWRSVLVRGVVSLLRSEGAPEDHAAYWAAVEALRSLIPGALTERDPTPDRTTLFRIDPTELTGREARAK